MNKTKLPISNKESIRAEVKQRISLLSEKEKNAATLSLCEKLLSCNTVQRAKNIIIYTALNDEIELAFFVEKIQKQSKNIFTIDVQGNSAALPSEGVILVPWRAFTLSGKRIGRGWGWYDRFLQKHSELSSIGVCFDCQIFPDLAQDTYDILMDEVVTWKLFFYSCPHNGQ